MKSTSEVFKTSEVRSRQVGKKIGDHLRGHLYLGIKKNSGF
jgi:hypothetical protein